MHPVKLQLAEVIIKVLWCGNAHS